MNKITEVLVVVLFSCSASKKIIVPERNNSAINGTQFYRTAVAFHWHERDSFAVKVDDIYKAAKIKLEPVPM